MNKKVFDPVAIKILSNISINENGCWNWLKSKRGLGYGYTYYKGKTYSTHRYMYEYMFGKIPDGLLIRHICHNKACCNPSHLKTGTHMDNYNDSKDVHLAALRRMASRWIICGYEFISIRDCRKATMISVNTIMKYTNKETRDVELPERLQIKALVNIERFFNNLKMSEN